MKQLDIWLEGVDFPIGLLIETDQGEVAFLYTEAWLKTPDAFGISVSLPLTEPLHLEHKARPYFDNLLHENDQLEALLQREGLRRTEIVGILYHLGADCAGALSCLPPEAPPVKRPGNLAEDYDPIESDVLNRLIDDLARGRPLPDGFRDPSPVAGYRRKISLAKLADGRFALPKPGSGVPTTHILKIPDPQHFGEAQQEAAAARMARACGFEASNSVCIQIGTWPVLLIERFDRHISPDGAVTRIHQEDFTQALGLPDRLKYERRAEGLHRFDVVAIRGILDKAATPAFARDHFLKASLFNLLIGNSDNHAKNHAFLYRNGQPHPAPLYDMVPIPLGNGYTDEFAFSIGSAKRMSELTRTDLILFCKNLGFSNTRAEQILKAAFVELAEKLEEASTELVGDLRLFDMLIGRNLNLLNDLLGLTLTFRPRDYLPERAGGWAMPS